GEHPAHDQAGRLGGWPPISWLPSTLSFWSWFSCISGQWPSSSTSVVNNDDTVHSGVVVFLVEQVISWGESLRYLLQQTGTSRAWNPLTFAPTSIREAVVDPVLETRAPWRYGLAWRAWRGRLLATLAADDIAR